MAKLQLNSIAAKLTWMNLLVSGTALLLACTAFLAYDQMTYRNSLIRGLSAQAEIVGDNSVSAVLFNDPDVALRTLTALRNSANVRAAAIVTPGGQPFAEYYRSTSDRISNFPAITAGAYEQWWQPGADVLVARRIRFQGKDVAIVYILASLQELSGRFWTYGRIAAVVLVVSLLVVYLISRRFRQSLAKPIERLAGIARTISRERNFNLRASAPADYGELQVLVSSFNEMLTDIQARDAALQEMAAESLATLQSIPQLVWTAAPDGTIDFLNQRWFDYTGMPAGATRADLDGYIYPEDRAAVREAWMHSTGTGDEFHLEYRLRRKDGMFRWQFAHAVPIRDESGKIQKWFGTATDIHEGKLSHAALLQSEKLAATGRLAATIAHEINNPLASITNLTHLIAAVGPTTQEQQELLSMLGEEVARVSHIVKSTLGLSRQTTTRAAAVPAELVESVFTLFERRLHSKNISVVKRYESQTNVSVVSSELRQVISNLLSNALDVLGVGGRLLVAVRGSFDWNEPRRRGVRIVIADSGPGIPLEVRSRLFEAFFSTKAEMGTGLGLWVSKSIVEKHGGSISFRTCTRGEKTGTIFSIFLPTEEVNAAATQVA